MFLEIFIALSCLLIQPTIHHFIGNFDECTASKVCNHTWTPVCGQLEEESNYRLFLDDCDLHEYNCDHTTKYVEVDTKVCSTKCTQRDQADADIPVTTPMTPPSDDPPKVSPNMTTEEIKTTSTKEVTESTKDKTDTSTIFVASSTLEMTTEERTTTTKATPATKPVIETTTTTELPPKRNKNNINDNENTIPEKTQRSKSVATPAKPKLDCYPESCSLPSTWETTPAGETRDFVQILRERYGNRIKFLRDTTHFPKQPTYARKIAFIPGYHMERRKQQYYANKLEK